VEAPIAQVAHVHDLAVDPADGALYAGTHHGLLRVPAEGLPSVVGDHGAGPDLMGFTVAAPGRYLASGHPAPGQGGPSSLGLAESTDGGATWTSLSLAGEADFHALHVRHGLVYGWDAVTGQFLVSEDERTWDARDRAVIGDFAVSPTDPDVLLATTEEGLVRSGDGGRAFEAVPSAPPLLLLAWAEDGTLLGADVRGGVHAGTDGGSSWQERGQLPEVPQALAIGPDGQVHAATADAVLTSQDGGATFAVRGEAPAAAG
jgi:hypothetical protein